MTCEKLMGGLEAGIGLLWVLSPALAAQAQAQAVRFLAICKVGEHALDAAKGNWKDEEGNIPLLDDILDLASVAG